MTDTQTESKAPQPLESIVRMVSLPLFLFSLVLFGLLLISRLFLLPRFTNIAIAGQVFTPSEAGIYERSLNAQLVTMEDERRELALPVTDETYDALKDVKRDQLQLIAVQSQLEQAAARAGIGTDQLVVIKMSVDAVSGHVRMEGDIRNAGPRSMTLLAGFVEEVESQTQFTDVVRPSFTRVTDPDVGIHSPFILEFSITQDSAI